MLFLKVLFLLILVSHEGETSRILAVISSAHYSHQTFFQPLWRELAFRGHEITVLTTNPTHENISGLREVDLSEAYKVIPNYYFLANQMYNIDILIMEDLVQRKFQTVEIQLANKEVQAIIHNKTEHFDLLFAEYLFPAMFAFKHRFNCSFIGVLSMNLLNIGHEWARNPTHSTMYPSISLPFVDNLTIWQRIHSFIVSYLKHIFQHMFKHKIDALVEKYFGPGFPKIEEISDSVDMVFTNANPLMNAIRPVGPHTISLVGGIHINEPSALPPDLQEFLDSATEGVIYFSLGTNVKSKDLYPEIRSIFINTFSKLPYKILWKYEANNLKWLPPNVKTIDWAPQQDILRHENTKLFIMQGGLQSIEEALYFHVPMIIFPCFGDQKANAMKVQSSGFGIALDYSYLTRNLLLKTIIEVIENPKYKETIQTLVSQMTDVPMKPLDRAVWWTEYVLRHKGAQHLKLPKIPLYQYYFLDIFAFYALVIIILVYSIKCTFRIIRKFSVRKIKTN